MSFFFLLSPKFEQPTGEPYEEIESPELSKPRRRKKRRQYKIITEKRRRQAVEIAFFIDWLDDD